MMRTTQFFISLCLCLLFTPVVKSQQILTIIEKFGTRADTIDKGNNRIVDINSQLEIVLSKEELLKQIALNHPQLQANVELEQELLELEKLLKDQTKIIKILKAEVQSIQSRSQFYTAMVNFHKTIMTAGQELEDEVNGYYKEYRLLYPNPLAAPMSRTEYVFNRLDEKLINVKYNLAAMDDKGIEISVVGYKRDRSGGGRVHIKNFDTYSDMEYITVPRWVTSISDQQRKKLETISDTLENNKIELKNIFDELKNKFKNFLPDLTCVSDLKTKFRNALSDESLEQAIAQTLGDELKRFLNDIDSIEEIVAAFKTDLSSWDITTPFAIGDAVVNIITQLEQTDLEFKSLLTKITNEPKLKEIATGISEDANNCLTVKVTEFKVIKEGILNLIQQQKKYIANKEIGEEVLKFTVGNLPTKGYLNLKGTGQRSNGDEILLEVILRKDGDGEKATGKTASAPITLEELTLVMQMVGVRSEVAVGVIFADPFSDDVDIVDPARQHFFAPMVALMLKFGSRNSTFYNNFVDLGVGINFASPDFNTDGIPEFGTGIIVTALKDILSTGLNYNVTHDTFYWFFGVNLPFSIPGIPISAAQTNIGD